MRQYIYSILAAAAIIPLAGCEKESAFKFNTEEGKLNCESISVDYVNRNKTVRAGEDETAQPAVSIGDFQVQILKSGNDTPVNSFKYSEMPGIVTLPVGTYKATASYGDNPEAGWNCPYYYGESTDFEIMENEITSGIKIDCKLGNIRVEVAFDTNGLSSVTDTKVVVKARDNAELTFTDKTKASGYFKFVEENTTLIATFSAKINGVDINREYTAFTDVKAGNYYKLNFSVKDSPTNTEPGTIVIGDENFTIDGTITSTDENHKIDPGDLDEGFTDDLRPNHNQGQKP